jgi:thiamine transport system ATP-binding protein
MTGLRLEGVDKRFGATAALEDVTIEVAEGEFFTLVGPSGCGKTTTLRIVAGLTEPTAGTVRFGDRDMAGVPPEERRIGIVFQNYALFPHMTVAENVAYGLRFRDPPRGQTRQERVAELLDLVDLDGMADRDPDQLSGGQQQRVALARALAPGPELLLLDEPMSALDARLRERLRRTVREIQSELGITTLYVTHDQAEALAISDRIAVLNGGRVEQVGRPETVYREPASRFVAAFVGDNNLFEVDAVESTPTGSVASAAGVDIAVDEPVEVGSVLAIRPEAMHLGPDDTTIQPVVESVEFLGDAYKVHCTLAGRDLVVKTDEPPSRGEQVFGFPAEAVQVVPRQVELD